MEVPIIMRFLDKIALNRLISIIAGFILGLIKIIQSSNVDDSIDIPTPKIKRKRPLRDFINKVTK
jgi:hypothetical protein